MNKSLKLSFLLSILAFYGCSDGAMLNINDSSQKDDPDITCEDECDPDEDAAECVSSSKRRSCELSEDGCYVLVTEKCPTGKVCKKGRCKAQQTDDPVIDPDVPDDPDDPDKPVVDPDACKSECIEGAKSCTPDGKTMVCGDYDDNGCFENMISPCEDDETCANGICTKPSDAPDQCEDECASAGTTQCTEDGKIQTCGNFDDDACLEWSEAASCPGNGKCKDGNCGCENACDQNGATQCDSKENGFRTCADTNNDGCLEWSGLTACTNTQCQGGACLCTHSCAKNAKECSGNGFRTCKTDSNGCRVWSEVTACSAGCENGACKVECTHQCDANAKECSGNGFRTCKTDANGCRVWSEVTTCNAGCQNGACKAECTHQCDANAKECSGNGFRTCKTDSNGCRVWSSVTSCSAGCQNGACKPEVVDAPTRYPANQALSPITAYSVKQMKAIAAKQSRNNVHFAKIGDSHFASGSAFMYCFASNKSHNLNGADFLENSIKAFQSDGTNSFSRDSVSSEVGWRVDQAIGGKLKEELNTMNPRFAFIDYGSNDMVMQGYSSTKGYFVALESYYKSYLTALDQMMSTGVIPIIIGTGIMEKPGVGNFNPRFFAPIFDALNRAMAEQYQIPYVNLMYLQNKEPLKSNHYGLNYESWFEGYLHHSSTNGGCDFTDNGMKYGHNARNRYSIEQLDRAYRTVVQGEAAPDKGVAFQGSGKKSDPYIMTDVNFTFAGNSKSGESNFSVYNCDTNTKEAGPETYFKLTISSTKKIRAFAVSSSKVDVDIHLLTALDSNKCLIRGDKWVEATLAAGTYYFVVDTYEGEGKYAFAVTECMSDDGLCGSSTTGG